MNILVTTPKSEMATAALEGEQVREDLSMGLDAYWFRTFRFRPKVDVGDRIYFTENGLIKGYGIIFEVTPADEGGEQCETTGRIWSGAWIIKYRDWHWLKTPVKWKGFQGILYIPNRPELERQLEKLTDVHVSADDKYDEWE